jgi:zinc transporter ZupT
MDTHFWIALSASSLAAVVTTIGIFVIRRFAEWARHNSTYFSCFAAGVLITVSFLHIVPEAFAMQRHAPAYLLGGYGFMHLFSRFVGAQVCGRTGRPEYAIGLIPLFGIGFHSFIDGVVYSITFSASVFTGMLAATGMVLHEFPEGIVTYALLVRGGTSERRSALWAFLAAAVTTPAGMLLSYPLVSSIGRERLGVLMALSSGVLVYVGATHLLPQAEKEPRRFSLAALASGALVAIGIVLSK